VENRTIGGFKPRDRLGCCVGPNVIPRVGPRFAACNTLGRAATYQPIRIERYSLHALIARNKWPLCIATGLNPGSTGRNCRNSVPVHVSYRAVLRARAFRPVSTKPAGHFRSSPGGYFHGMVAKAKAGELNLARTIWGLRVRDRKAGEGRLPRRAN
jgi:hypothetical protein